MTYSKYKAVKAELDGITFDSRSEMRRYCALKLLLLAKEINGLVLQPEFVLMEGFIYNGKAERPIKYVADFKYTDIKTGKTIVEDVKGCKTKEYLIKRKLFINKYCLNTNLIFMEV